jgi:2-polyprenyl-3-methyl-5-hydroxy-6-metoxy-1,4-benzoquinol methylase
MSDDSARARRENRETISSYERCAEQYAQSTRGDPSEIHSRLIHELIRRVGSAGRVLEIGSGPGWDADHLEAEGIDVVRTDVTQAFIDFQHTRGKRISRLDVIEDEIEGEYAGILCLYVLQHVARPLFDSVLRKLSAALSRNGVLLVALRQGKGHIREVSASSGVYHTTLWLQAEFISRLAHVALHAEQSHTFTDEDGDWLAVLASKQPTT